MGVRVSRGPVRVPSPGCSSAGRPAELSDELELVSSSCRSSSTVAAVCDSAAPTLHRCNSTSKVASDPEPDGPDESFGCVIVRFACSFKYPGGSMVAFWSVGATGTKVAAMVWLLIVHPI